MASLASVDRLNILYYGEMELSDAEKKMRIVMSGAFQDIVRKYYDTVHAITANEKIGEHKRDLLLAAAVVSLRRAYLGFFDKYYETYVREISRGGEPYYGTSAWRDKHALDFAVWLTRTARNEPNIAFENSHSLAVTRTEINAMSNLAALDGAYRSGMRSKTWSTFGDAKVRPTHKAVNGVRIPIDEPFTVGGYKLMFPNDTSLGAGAEEIVNCRCTLRFDGGNPLTNGSERGIIKKNSECFISNDKINKFFLLEGAKHAQEFFDVGYGSADGERLKKDISDNFDINSAVDIKIVNGVEKFSIFMYLGVERKKRFRTVWQKDSPDSVPRIITAHRED